MLANSKSTESMINLKEMSLNKKEIAYDESSHYQHRFGDGSILDASSTNIGSPKR